MTAGGHLNRNIIVIGASAGGVEALPRLLGSLRPGFPASFFVTLHVSPRNESYLPKLISRRGSLPAEHPRHGARIRPGRIYVAPPDYHLTVGRDVVCLSHGPKENRHRPAIDPLFRSAARHYGNRVAGVLLTGNLDDGVAGLLEIREHHGLTIVQDPEEAPFPDMPRNALLAMQPDHCLKLREIEDLLKNLPGSEFPRTNGKRKNSARKPGEDFARPPNGEPLPLVCPECQGPMWEFREGKFMRYQCLVGHRYALDTLLQEQSAEMESALWFALRAIEERINLQRRLSDQTRELGQPLAARTFEAKARENLKHARLLRRVLEQLSD